MHEEEIYHHGILGQKWGVRHGPPYPLDENGYPERKRAEVRRINETAKINLNNAVNNKAWVEYGNAHQQRYKHQIEDVEDVLNYMNEDFDNPKIERKIRQIEEDIRSRPDFQNMLNQSYERAIEGEKKEHTQRAMNFVSGVITSLGVAGGAAGVGLAVYDVVKRR